MKPRAPALLGGVIGLAGAMLVLGLATGKRNPPTPPMLADAGGPIRAVVLQYASGSGLVAPVFQQYLRYQSPALKVYIACPEPADFDEISRLIGPVPPALTPVYTHHEQTAWSRDRWVALSNFGASSATTEPTLLLAPKGELRADVWPQRAGDAHIAENLASALPQIFSARRSPLFFDGGDFLADGPYVFATRALLERNLQHTVTTRENLLDAIARDLQRTPILMDQAPAHHAGMFMMAAGPDPQAPPDNPARRVMLVADPSLGKPLYTSTPDFDAAFTGGPDFSADTQKQFDSVAQLCEQKGYRVVRIPVVPAREGKMYLTYVNVLLDLSPENKPLVYMSCYAGQEKLNAAAAAVWQSLGYEVRPIDCTSVWQMGGTLHCLVNVFRRDP